MYAEAVLRGGSGGSEQRALELVNALRQRAYGDASGNISVGELSLDFILDERARELKWEAHRRTDLIRFGRFTGSTYLWQWKGGSINGTAVADTRNLYPLPAADLTANPTLVQNSGYYF
jgi:starch-binding outer membrane protein, SusD/RagB family